MTQEALLSVVKNALPVNGMLRFKNGVKKVFKVKRGRSLDEHDTTSEQEIEQNIKEHSESSSDLDLLEVDGHVDLSV